MKLFDSISKSVRRIDQLNGKPINWYTCGPTVYDDMHLGHGRAYIYVDILQRIASRLGNITVSHALGMTDIDDKIINRATELGQTPLDVARFYEQRFHEDMDRLGVSKPECVKRVSESMDAIVDYVDDIVGHRFAYVGKSTGSVYFDVAKYDAAHGYDKLVPKHFCGGGQQQLQQQQQQQNVVDREPHASEKRDFRDFALWKRIDGRPDDVSLWSSPWGVGRPGWHIECSAMTAMMHGDELDVHAGGIDLAFPHHANEIAQCGAARDSGEPWPRQCFVHIGHLHIAGRKMSKSLKNFTTVRQLLDDGHSAASFRLFCAMTKYGEPTEFSHERLANARDLLMKMREFDSRARSLHTDRQSTKRWAEAEFELRHTFRDSQQQVRAALLGNADTPLAIQHIVALLTAANRYLDSSSHRDPLLCQAVAIFVRYIVDDVLGVALQAESPSDFESSSSSSSSSPSSSDSSNLWIDRLVEFRADVRRAALSSTPKASAVLALCDEMRDTTLPALGVVANDSDDDTVRWRYRTQDDD